MTKSEVEKDSIIIDLPTYIHYTLAKFGRRIIEEMKSLPFLGSLAIALVVVGFTLVVTGAVNITSPVRFILFGLGAISVTSGVYTVGYVYKQLQSREKAEERREEQKFKDLMCEIKGFRADMKK